jgi:DNA-binding CsgD family transcriptional regulator/tetratricopeptide (TPR) repeat protein
MIVGRDDELDEISRFLRESEIDDGSAVLVLEGPPGVGKTTLFKAAVAAASRDGLRVLEARPSRAEMDLSFAGLGDLLAGVLEEVEAELPEPQLRALRVALSLEPPGEGGTGAAVHAGLLGSLRALGRRGRALIAIDDLQWLDRDSTEALAFAVRRLGEAPIRLLAARRDEEKATPFERESTVGVGPMSLGAIRRMLHDRIGASFPRGTLVRLHEISGGNPFYALELARVLVDRGGRFALDEDVPIPADLSELLQERLARLPERTREAVDAVAVAGEPAADLLRAVVGAEGWAALAPAFDAQVIEPDGRRIRFAHPLLGAAALQRIDPEHRRELNARLAELVEDVEQRARHVAQAALGPDADAAATLERAAETARRRGAPDAAAELLEHALRLAPDDDERARLTIAAAAQHNAANDAERAAALLNELLERTPSGRRRAEALLELLRAETSDPMPALAEAALAEVDDEDGLRAEILLELASWEEISVGISDALEHAREAAQLASSVKDDSVLAEALAYVGHLETLAGSEGWLETLQRAQKLEQRGFTVPAWLSPAHWIGVRLMWGDDLDSARELLEAARQQAADAGDASSQSGLCFHLAQLETRAGAAAKAREYAEEGWELAEASGRQQATAINAYARALVEAHFGDPVRAREIAAEALEVFESLGDRFFTIHTRSALATLELSEGNHAAALEALAPARDLRASTGVGEPGIFPFDADEIEAMVGVGQIDEATALTEELESRARDLDRPRLLATSLRCRGLLAAARGELESAISVLSAALDEHGRLPAPLERGRTLLVLGAVQRRARQKAAARQTLESARELFEQIDERLWREQAVEELARIGGRARSSGTLTAGEQRIAQLVAEGRSNKEIAAALFLSVNTVESTLSRAYSKLGVRSRTELASRLATEK